MVINWLNGIKKIIIIKKRSKSFMLTFKWTYISYVYMLDISLRWSFQFCGRLTNTKIKSGGRKVSIIVLNLHTSLIKVHKVKILNKI